MGLCTIKTSADFRRVKGGRRWSSASFLIEVKPRVVADAGCDLPRFGFTVTRKLGNAVLRNRIRRRLKEAIRATDPTLVQAGHDYVVVARASALDQPFASLKQDIEKAFVGLHRRLASHRTPKR